MCHLREPCSIQALLSAPNPDDPLAENVAKHWKENEKDAIATGGHTQRRHPPHTVVIFNAQRSGCQATIGHLLFQHRIL